MSVNDLLEQLMDEHRIMLEAIQGFQAADFEQRLPDSTWSVRDVFAHLAIVNSEAVQTLERIARGRAIPAVPGETHFAGDERGISKRRTLPLHKVMDEFRRSHKDLVEAVKRLPESKWRKPGEAADAEGIVERVVEQYARQRAALVAAIESTD